MHDLPYIFSDQLGNVLPMAAVTVAFRNVGLMPTISKILADFQETGWNATNGNIAPNMLDPFQSLVTIYFVAQNDTNGELNRIKERVQEYFATQGTVLSINAEFMSVSGGVGGSISPALGGSNAGGSTIEYVVKSGDRLSAIAAKFGMTTAQLAALNGISNPNVISIGQKLKVTGSATGNNSTTKTPTNPGNPQPEQSSITKLIDETIGKTGLSVTAIGAILFVILLVRKRD